MERARRVRGEHSSRYSDKKLAHAPARPKRRILSMLLKTRTKTRRKLVGARRFELRTSWSRTRRSTRLSHAPIRNSQPAQAAATPSIALEVRLLLLFGRRRRFQLEIQDHLVARVVYGYFLNRRCQVPALGN